MAAQINVAVIEADLHEPTEALALLSAAADLLTDLLGPAHPHTLRCRANHALIQRRVHGVDHQAQVDEAVEAVEAVVARIGGNHPSVAELKRGRPVRRVIDPHPF